MSAPLRPMLATRATPFDSEEYSFEVKWDGVRALAAVENGRWQLSGRAGSDYTHRYPELAMLRHLPSGTVIDGELVALRGGCANFSALLQRHQRNCRDDLHLPGPSIYYVVFDLLFVQGRSLLRQPLCERRERLRELLGAVDDPRLIYSDGVVGRGRDFFREGGGSGTRRRCGKTLGQCLPPRPALACLEEDQAESDPALRDRRLSRGPSALAQRPGGFATRAGVALRRRGQPRIYRTAAS